MDLNNPIPVEWNKYVTQSPIGLDVVPDILYDVLTYTDNTTTDMPFFTTARSDRSLGNMRIAGMLPNPEAFLCQYVRVHYRTQMTTEDAGAAGAFASVFNDVVLLQRTGWVEGLIGNKQYGPWPLSYMASGSYPQGVIATAGAEAANLVHDYAQQGGVLFALFPYLMIAPLQQFSFNLKWTTAVNLTANVDIQFSFEGQRARSIQ